MDIHPQVHITVPGSTAAPRDPDPADGIVIHRVPHLHPDDVTTVDGIPVTTEVRS